WWPVPSPLALPPRSAFSVHTGCLFPESPSNPFTLLACLGNQEGVYLFSRHICDASISTIIYLRHCRSAVFMPGPSIRIRQRSARQESAHMGFRRRSHLRFRFRRGNRYEFYSPGPYFYYVWSTLSKSLH